MFNADVPGLLVLQTVPSSLGASSSSMDPDDIDSEDAQDTISWNGTWMKVCSRVLLWHRCGGFHSHGGTPYNLDGLYMFISWKIQWNFWWWLGVPPIFGKPHVLLCNHSIRDCFCWVIFRWSFDTQLETVTLVPEVKKPIEGEITVISGETTSMGFLQFSFEANPSFFPWSLVTSQGFGCLNCASGLLFQIFQMIQSYFRFKQKNIIVYIW